MGLRINPASSRTQSNTVISREGGAESKRASTTGVRGAGGRMEARTQKGFNRAGGRQRTIGRIIARARS
jgi:hypothetical protein